MAYFDRFDICEAHAVLEWDYNVGGILRERPSNARRNESTGVQLSRMQFKTSPGLSSETLTENAREIYDELVERYHLPKSETEPGAGDRNKKVSNPEKPGECRACVQGYTREGMAAYPDHVALCPLHSAAADLLRRAAEALNESWGEGGNNGAHPLAEEINTALGAS